MTEAADIGVDTGGTFTDFVSAEGLVLKLPSSAEDPGAVMEEGVETLLFPKGGRRSFVKVAHGTTVATNALLTDDLAPCGVLITGGFRDLLALGRQNRPDLYALSPRPRWTGPERDLIFEIPERIGADGKIVTALDEKVLSDALATLESRGVDAVAICFLQSYRNSAHEKIAAKAAKAAGFHVTASSTLVPEFREFERFSTLLPTRD